MIGHQFNTGILLGAAFALQAATASASQAAIEKSTVAAAMCDAGIDVSMDRIIFLTGAIGQIKDPRLRVETAERWGEDKIRVRMACVEAQQCIPFFVAAQWDQKDALPVLSQATAPYVSTMAVVAASARPDVVHVSSPAMLELDGRHIHIWTSVICLEEGAIGQTIHATSKDGRQAYRAEVVGPGELRGAL